METIKTNDTLIAIYKKMHEVMKAIYFIAKDKTNEHFKYDYASEAAIKKAVHEQLIKQGLLFHLSCESLERIETVNDKGNKNTITNVKVLYSFIDIDTGVKIEGYFFGTGEDKSDKGTYKAITGAIKYILTSTFLIPTGDDPEKETEKQKEQPAGKITPNPAVEIEPLDPTAIAEVNESKELEALHKVWESYKGLQSDKRFIKLVNKRKVELVKPIAKGEKVNV